MSKLNKLWEYQTAELELAAIDAKLKSTEARQKLAKLHGFLSEQQGQIKSMEKQLEGKRTLVDKLSAAFEQMEHSFELEQDEIGIMENDEECTAAEMSEARRALEKLLEQITATRKELYDTLTWIEKTAEALKTTWSKASKAKKEYDTLKLICEEELKAEQPAINAAKANIEAAAKEVEPALLQKYIGLKKNHQNPVARVENNKCTGCNMSLPTAVIRRVTTSSEVVECENCGRILFA